ncbi:MAG TPA: NAD(P)-dependent oxidoreductase [Candidatus Bathyarchaeota archaeon]|nr:NAD(P)-dependent oxidoreductase [Candidatus Bathyarchaeota archaeon]
MDLKRIGFIGIGLMGKGMSLNLLKAGYPLTVWNRTKSKALPVVEAGAKLAGSPKEVAENSEVVITMVTGSKDVKEVLLGEQGAIHGAKAGDIFIDMSTISPQATVEIAEELAKKGVEMLDAPVSGGVIGANNGTLSIMVGGKEEVFEECKPIFEAMGKTITYIGGNGAGQVCKAVNQILVGTTMLGVAEALVFASKAGVDVRRVHQAVSGGAAGSWQLTNNGARVINGDMSPGFKIKHYLKDLEIIMETARATSMPLPATSLVLQMFRYCQARDMLENGTQAVVKAVEALANASVS